MFIFFWLTDFIYKNYEREMKKKISKEKRETRNSRNNSNRNKSKNKKENSIIYDSFTLKIQKINLILQQMIKKFRGDPRYEHLSEIINSNNEGSLDILKEYCAKDKFIGMLMLVKYFRNLSKFFF